MKPKQEVKKEKDFTPIKFGLATLGVIALAASCVGIACQIHGSPNGGIIGFLIGVALGLVIGTLVACGINDSNTTRKGYRY